jgi:hypothetical protein
MEFRGATILGPVMSPLGHERHFFGMSAAMSVVGGFGHQILALSA